MDTAAKSTNLIKGATGDWEVVIGMEVHAQVSSNAKLFSGASTEFGGAPNAHVSLVDAAMPGMLPVINAECVRQTIRTGVALDCKINLKSVFDRKNYFYPDLPQGYQISQYKSPIVGEGELEIDSNNNTVLKVGIERIHLEQDAGKLLHEQRSGTSYVDLNRSGVALMEIVSRPDMRSAEDAMNFLARLRQILRYIGTCDGDMEKGSLRADVNVSVRRVGATKLGTRCEIKNVNSINFVGLAIFFEQKRQIDLIEDGGTVHQETRLFDPNKLETRPMRDKEEAHDYRYFPDPDLLPLEVTQAEVDELKSRLPELGHNRRHRFQQDYALSLYDAHVLTIDRETADYFEEMVKRGSEPKASANWLINEYFGRLNKDGLTIAAGPLTPRANTEIVQMISANVISGKIAKEVLEIVWNEGGDPRAIVEQRGMKQVTDTGEIEKIVDDIIAQNPDKVAQAQAKPQLAGWFVGQVMKASAGKANPQAVNDLLKAKLGL